MGQKVVVGMSGGVDSSVAAYLLKRQGYEVIGITMQLWREDAGRERQCGNAAAEKAGREPQCGNAAAGKAGREPQCGNAAAEKAGREPQCGNAAAGKAGRERQCGNAAAEKAGREPQCSAAAAAEDAARVAGVLGIPHAVLSFEKEFKRCVVDYFVEAYLQGRTPNPCIACNRYVKWEALLQRAMELGADYIATGHYARIDRLPGGRYAIRNSVTAGKDQTYALYGLTQEQLSRTLMPVGGYTKEQIRELAERAGLPVAQKPDSQEICFVPDNDYAGLIHRLAGERTPGPGSFVTKEGRVLGRHRGITHYTIGQRRGLELPMGERVFVTEIRPETNEVVIGKNEDLFVSELYCGGVNFMAAEDIAGQVRVKAKIRYNHAGEFCTLEKLPDGRLHCLFERPVRAPAPGQAAVFYDGEYVLCGGTILKGSEGAPPNGQS